jgi:hypothetical protein
MTMPPHQQRVVEERHELCARLEKLIAFIATPMFGGLDPAERARMRDQAATMTRLAEILSSRIGAFAPSKP